MKSLTLSAIAASGLLFGVAAASIQTSINTPKRSSAQNQPESDTAAARNPSGTWMDYLWGHDETRGGSGKHRPAAKAQAAKESEAATQPPSPLQDERADPRARTAAVPGPARSGDVTGSISRPSALHAALRQSLLKERVRRVGGMDGPLKVGAIVPATIHLRPLPTSVVRLKPAWQGHEFFVYGKEIVVVQPRTSKITELVPYTE